MQVQLRTRQICAVLILDLTMLKNTEPFTIISTMHVPLNAKLKRQPVPILLIGTKREQAGTSEHHLIILMLPGGCC
jgi:hypothetical protein